MYATHLLIRHYLDRVVPNCLEQQVDHLWTQVLRLYFELSLYGIEREAHVAQTSLIRANVIVSREFRGQFCQFLFIESKRAPPANRMPSERSWDRAATQLANYMAASKRDLARPSDAPKLFGIVAIGRSVRFYSMAQGSSRLISINNTIYNFVQDADEIEEFLFQIRSRTL
ncbi:hypothetical protein N7474_003898 [Penicillium riverlandense]|uniref:uncharacterized protein n=1 Tax=Penicillium riverlandense TaxID=1903569 RepID=UPI002547C16E|nr:uncharacterized protein N7474_003898 [Penicillium riverlandense]KAJ5818307.1 hypothetical protein N7474_003898 [Penicillium riverlandense]